MKQSAKKLISLLGAASLVSTMAVMPVHADPMTIFEDNMESYTVGTTVYGSGKTLVSEKWATSPTFGGDSTQSKISSYSVQQDTEYANSYNSDDTVLDDKVLQLYSRKENTTNYQAALNLAADVSELGDCFEYSVDIRSYFYSSCSPVMGIRLGNPKDETCYYELALFNNTSDVKGAENAKVSPPRFTKVQYADLHTPAMTAEGSEPPTWKYTEYGETATSSGLYSSSDMAHHTDWFTLVIGRNKNTFNWSVYSQRTGETIWADSWTDDSPLFDGYGVLQVFEYQTGSTKGKTLINNVSAKKMGTRIYREESTKSISYSDDMQSYTPESTSVYGTGKKLIGDWYTSSVYGIEGTGSKYEIKQDQIYCNAWNGSDEYTDNIALSMRPKNLANSKQAALTLKNDTKANAIAYTYSVDLRNYFSGATAPIMGMRLSDPADETNYYELALISNTGVAASSAEARVSPPRFTKVKGANSDTPAIAEGGEEPESWIYTQYGENATDSGLYVGGGIPHHTDWFTLTMTKNSGTISWTVTNKATGEIFWSDSFFDANPLFTEPARLQVFAYGDEQRVYVDNVTYTTEEPGQIYFAAAWRKPTLTAPMLLMAQYDDDGLLISKEILETEEGATGSYSSLTPLEMRGSMAKLFLWDKGTQKPLYSTSTFRSLSINSCVVTFPTYTKKAATFTLDGDNADRNAEIIDLMHDYGINATVDVNNTVTDYGIYTHDDIEIANSATDIEMYLTEEYVDENGNTVTPPTYDECVSSIEAGESSIVKNGASSPKGLAWPYFAPEERDFYDNLVKYASDNGYQYALNGQVSNSLDAPEDWMNWSQTTWMTKALLDNALSTAKTMIDSASFDKFMIFSASDYNSDLSTSDALTAYRQIFEAVSDDSVWKATNLEICEYVKACNSLEIASSYVYNPSDITVYLLINGVQYVAAPNSYAAAVN